MNFIEISYVHCLTDCRQQKIAHPDRKKEFFCTIKMFVPPNLPALFKHENSEINAQWFYDKFFMNFESTSRYNQLIIAYFQKLV